MLQPRDPFSLESTTEPGAQMRTSYTDLKPLERRFVDLAAQQARNGNGLRTAMGNASRGIGVVEGATQELAAQVAPVIEQDDAEMDRQWVADTVAEFAATEPGDAPKTPDMTFDSIMAFARQKVPVERAKLKDPTALSLIVAGILAAGAPPEGAAQILAQPFLYRQRQQAEEQAVLDKDREENLREHDEELSLLLKDFDVKENRRAREADREGREDIARITQEGLNERHGDTLKANAERDFWRNIGSGKMSPTAAYIMARDSGYFTPEELGSFKEEADRRENATVGKTEAQIKETDARTRLTESRILSDEAKRGETERKNKLFDTTFDDEVKTVKERLKGYGLSNALKDLQRKKLEIELPYVDDEVIAGLAATRARTVYTQQLTQASKDKNAGVNKNLDLEIEFLTDDLEKDRQSLKEIEGKATEARAKADGERKAGIESDADYWEVLATQYEKARKAKSAEVEKSIKALRDLRRQANSVGGEVSPVDPMSVDTTFKGKIGK